MKKGGDRRLKHGLTSTIRNVTIQERIAEVRQAVVDPLNLEHELEILRAILGDYIDRHGALMDAFGEWYKTHHPAYQALLNAKTERELAEAAIGVREAAKLERPRQLPASGPGAGLAASRQST